jgi:predicted ATPase/DNA-binding winged helix-turn-helix (wHTH) protein
MPTALKYQDFELRPQERRLFVHDKEVSIGARAYDLLLALAERHERVVSKHELLDLVWPQLVVEENNLQVQIHALRKLLGPSVIATVPGRGYRFTASSDLPAMPAPMRRQGHLREHHDGNLPEHIPEIYGRAEALEAASALLGKERLVTITGASGIGKTRLAQAMAHRMRGCYSHGVWMVELASTSDPALIAPLVAQTLGLAPLNRAVSVDDLVDALSQRTALLVLDNCEHLLDGVGALAMRLLAHAPALVILATSQERLHVPEECVYRLDALAVPAHDDRAHAGDYGAVRLFVERARALDRGFALDERNAGAVIDICRALDGIALAIELAAARLPTLGVQGVREHLGEALRVFGGGAHIPLKRHQTLRAALDWSHQLLDAREQQLFRRLAVFVDGFSIEGLQQLCADADGDPWAWLDVLSALVEKSLVLVDTAERPRYRLLETTRAYAMEKLAEAGETEAWRRRHAEATRAVLELAAQQRDTNWSLGEVNNMRAAFAWAMGPGGDRQLAVALAASSATMVMVLAGQAREGMQRLLEVEPFVNAETPTHIAARYWQWLGRGGLDGRLPTSRCVQALTRAEAMFRSAGNSRHIHGCLRMRAEALLACGDLAGAEEDLRAAHAMEGAQAPLADRMRRLRVQALLYAATGLHEEAISTLTQAHELAAAAAILRYELTILSDHAGVLLQMRRYAQAGEQFRSLAERARRHRAQKLILAKALIGLAAASLAQARVDDATEACAQSLGPAQRCGIFLPHADIYAWLLVQRSVGAAAARLVGAAEAFHVRSELSRDRIKQFARAEVLRALHARHVPGQIDAWLAEGAVAEEPWLAASVSAALAEAGGAP